MFKFICKDLWSTVWDKQIDNLRTNHRGVFVLQDSAFRPLETLRAPGDTDRYASLQVAFATGILQGALSSLGINANTSAELALPQCAYDCGRVLTLGTFQVRVT